MPCEQQTGLIEPVELSFYLAEHGEPVDVSFHFDDVAVFLALRFDIDYSVSPTILSFLRFDLNNTPFQTGRSRKSVKGTIQIGQ